MASTSRRVSKAFASQEAFVSPSKRFGWLRGGSTSAVRDLGPINLKNIADPVRVFSLQVGAPVRVKPRSGSETLRSRVGGLLLLLRARGPRPCSGWLWPSGWLDWQTGLTSREPAASSVAAVDDKLAAAPRFSFVVLPFENLSGDSGQQNLADGLTERPDDRPFRNARTPSSLPAPPSPRTARFILHSRQVV